MDVKLEGTERASIRTRNNGVVGRKNPSPPAYLLCLVNVYKFVSKIDRLFGLTGRMKIEPGSNLNRGQDSGPSSVDPKRTDYQEDEIEPLSNCPYFHVTLMKSHVKSPYTLGAPSKFHGNLPSHLFHTVLIHRGKTWEMDYLGSEQHQRKFSAWKQFGIDNNLKVGDACVFELIHCDNESAKFKVQILRGDIPKELQVMLHSAGDTSDNPIVL